MLIWASKLERKNPNFEALFFVEKGRRMLDGG